MKPKEPLQSIIDPFVRGIGGELISGLIANNSPALNADYRFLQHGVIAELKALEDESFGEPRKRKVGSLMSKWQQEGRLIVFGTNKIDTQRLPLKCQDE